MRATDFIRANADKNEMVPLQTAIEAAYMAQEDALASLRNQAAANIMPTLINAYVYESAKVEAHINDIRYEERLSIPEAIAELSVRYANTLVKRLKKE
jgi:hypothetical protein